MEQAISNKLVEDKKKAKDLIEELFTTNILEKINSKVQEIPNYLSSRLNDKMNTQSELSFNLLKNEYKTPEDKQKEELKCNLLLGEIEGLKTVLNEYTQQTFSELQKTIGNLKFELLKTIELYEDQFSYLSGAVNSYVLINFNDDIKESIEKLIENKQKMNLRLMEEQVELATELLTKDFKDVDEKNKKENLQVFKIGKINSIKSYLNYIMSLYNGQYNSMYYEIGQIRVAAYQTLSSNNL